MEKNNNEFTLFTDEDHPGISDEEWENLKKSPSGESQKIQEELSKLKEGLGSLYKQILPYTNPRDMQLAPPDTRLKQMEEYPYLFDRKEDNLPDLWWNNPKQPPGPAGPYEENRGDEGIGRGDPYDFKDMLLRLRRGRGNI